MIELSGIHKSFKVARRNAGFTEAVKALFQREYETIHALKDISFSIKKGEMVGYIGPNGAGKSSTIKVMSGILTPDTGTCVINGRVPWKERKEHVQDIGVVFGQRSQLWWDVPVIDSFLLIKEIYSVSDSLYKKNFDELVEMLQLQEIVRTPTRQLSLGQRMRCEIAASLLHSPSILFLDEPTIGLDAVSKIAVRNFIKEQNKLHGTTVILTTHDMQDIEALAERILLIGKGRILLDGSLDELKKRNSTTKTIVLAFQGGDFVVKEGMTLVEYNGSRAVLCIETEKMTVSEAITFLSQQVEIVDLSVSGTSTEEMVVHLYEEFAI